MNRWIREGRGLNFIYENARPLNDACREIMRRGDDCNHIIFYRVTGQHRVKSRSNRIRLTDLYTLFLFLFLFFSLFSFYPRHDRA